MGGDLHGLRPFFFPRFRRGTPMLERARLPWSFTLGAMLALVLDGPQSRAQTTIQFEDVADQIGITFQRVPSAHKAIAEQFMEDSLTQPVRIEDFARYTLKADGAPGVVIWDFDGDGDQDIYVTNGPGAANHLYSNQLQESGVWTYQEVGQAAGVAAWDQDSSGACAGDLDNDGDADLYVLGRGESNRLFRNLGDGSFEDVTSTSGVGGGSFSSMSSSFGDVNGDGLLDLYVANNFDMSNLLPIVAEPFALNEPDQLFLNLGGCTFADVSESSGIRNLAGVPPGTAGITWAVTLADFDQDGDADILTASDNAAIPTAAAGGVDRGFLRLLRNDGTGQFVDDSAAVGLLQWPGDWMGVEVADFNGDGRLDLFGTNTGDYFQPFLGVPGSGLTEEASRWLLQNADGTLDDPGVGVDVASAFGWGCGAFDADNDGDIDLAYVGGIEVGPFVEASNFGVLLQNDGAAGFRAQFDAFPVGQAADHRRRSEHGMAFGDLDGDGFVDLVSVSSINTPPPMPVLLFRDLVELGFDSPFNDLAGMVPTMAVVGVDPLLYQWTGVVYPRGTLAVERNRGGSGLRSVAVTLRGSVGSTASGQVNRDGVGAVIRCRPFGDSVSTQVVTAGSSYASQHSLERVFGLGTSGFALLDVLWPGGTRNRLYGVQPGQDVLFPEIPYSYDDPDLGFGEYAVGVWQSLSDLVQEGVLTTRRRREFFFSALAAYHTHH